MVTIVVSDELRSLSVAESVKSGVVDPEDERGDGCGLCRGAAVGVGGMSLRDGARSMKATRSWGRWWKNESKERWERKRMKSKRKSDERSDKHVFQPETTHN